MFSAGAAWGSPQSQIGPHCAGKTDGPGDKGVGHTDLTLVPVLQGSPEDALPSRMPVPGMCGHLHFLGQLQQGNVVTIEFQDSLLLLGKDVEPRGDHCLLDLEFFAPPGVGIPWE